MTIELTEEGEPLTTQRAQMGEYVINPMTGDVQFVPGESYSYYEAIHDTIQQFQEEHGEKDISELMDLFSNTYAPVEIKVAQNLEEYNFS